MNKSHLYPHLWLLRQAHDHLIARLLAVVLDVINEMQRNNSLSAEARDRLLQYEDNMECASMLMTILQSGGGEQIFNGFIQALRTLHRNDILAQLNDHSPVFTIFGQSEV